MNPTVIAAELTWTGRTFERQVQIAVGADGKITAVGALGLEPTLRLPERALLPGFVNAHSHAFQRGLRGRGETFPGSAGDFWSWREAMYGLAQSLTRDSFRALCRQAFREMRRAGITAVGEFHYLHHAHRGDFALDFEVLEAAREVGIRIVLLEAYYRTGGIGKPLEAAQRRFETKSPDAYWRQMERLAEALEGETQSLGAVAHSIRAATPEEVRELYAEARVKGLPFHMHVEEQQREIDDCVAAYSARPMALLADFLELSPSFTAVHCTHTAAEDLARFLHAGAQVCICPLTEANLGDGVADVPAMRSLGGSICLGSDSNARISMVEEMRWLEYVQRLVRERRGVVRNRAGEVAAPLLEAATVAGARALGLPAGTIAPGNFADLVALNLGAPTLEGATPETLLPAFLCGAAEEAIAATAVSGRWEEHSANND